LPTQLKNKPVSMLTAKELRDYRDSLAATHSPASINRITCPLKAALTRVANLDEHKHITNDAAWTFGLEPIPGATRSRNVVLSEDELRAIVAAAYEESHEFGLLVETAALTGARYSQIARIRVNGLQAGRCRVIIPSSGKGRGNKQIQSRAVTITAALVLKLQKAGEGRAAGAHLLAKPDGSKWRAKHQSRSFKRAAVAAGLDPAVVTFSALRHTSITHLLVRGLPIRAIAERHDTSVKMIEQTYGASISEHTDTMFAQALPDLAAGTVVPFKREVA
jgi:integrase